MDEKFFKLPEEKRQRILNGGFRVFSQNSYKKSPMSEIAAEAGISKALLFHYFRNKRELYLFLWEESARITTEYMDKYRCYEPGELFEMMERGMRAKLDIMRLYPEMAAFCIRAFYEKAEDVCGEIHASYQRHFDIKARHALSGLDPEQFVPGLNLELMYREMYWASEGYAWELMQRGDALKAETLEKDFSEMLEFWRMIYRRREE